jgi:hypothetical protein
MEEIQLKVVINAPNCSVSVKTRGFLVKKPEGREIALSPIKLLDLWETAAAGGLRSAIFGA